MGIYNGNIYFSSWCDDQKNECAGKKQDIYDGHTGDIQATYRRHIENTNNARSSRMREIQICIGYGQPTVQGIHINCKYMFVWDISCQPLGEECKLGSFFATFGRVVVKCTFLKKYILDIHSQQFGTILTVEDICWYWIYHANSWGQMSVCQFMCAGLEYVDFQK